MALANRKQVDRHKITDNTKLARISQSFEAGKHLELQSYDGEAAMIYQMQELTDDVKGKPVIFALPLPPLKLAWKFPVI